MSSIRAFLDAEQFGWKDALDILLVAFLVYAFILLLRRTRSAPVAIGILAFFVLWRISTWLELETLSTLLDFAVAAMPFVVVLLFQNTIRRAFVTLGRNPLFRFFAHKEDEHVVQSISLAVLSMASQGVGAIIAIEREVGLRNYAESGIALDCRLSYELLLSLFHPRSPLHDGAVVISHGRIQAASCMLPLTTKPHLSVKYGSRHRAAIGLSEETDAMVVVVSEERGRIALVQDGEVSSLEARELQEALTRVLGSGKSARTIPHPATA